MRLEPIEGVGVNTAAFIGYAKSGEFNKPTFISNWSDFCRVFGEDDETILTALGDELGKSTVELLAAKRASRKGLLDFAQQTIVKTAHDRKAAGLKFIQQAPVEVHPMKEYRRVPLSQLRRVHFANGQIMHVAEYAITAPIPSKTRGCPSTSPSS